MQRRKNKLRALNGVLLTAVFLLLGFCPLRNVLVKLAQQGPPRKAQPVPEYAKITNGKECVAFSITEQQASQPALSADFVFNFDLSYKPFWIVAPAPQSVACFSDVPLYLRNRALLI